MTEIDAIAGKRKRSEFIEEAIRTKLRLEKQHQAIKLMRMEGLDVPAWYMPGLEDYDDVSDFIHDLRRNSDEHRRAKLALSDNDDPASSR